VVPALVALVAFATTLAFTLALSQFRRKLNWLVSSTSAGLPTRKGWWWWRHHFVLVVFVVVEQLPLFERLVLDTVEDKAVRRRYGMTTSAFLISVIHDCAGHGVGCLFLYFGLCFLFYESVDSRTKCYVVSSKSLKEKEKKKRKKPMTRPLFPMDIKERP